MIFTFIVASSRPHDNDFINISFKLAIVLRAAVSIQCNMQDNCCVFFLRTVTTSDIEKYRQIVK